jgi:hypothetical protein
LAGKRTQLSVLGLILGTAGVVPVSMFWGFFSKRFKIRSAKGMEHCDRKNDACAKLGRGKVHRDILSGHSFCKCPEDLLNKNISNLGDFDEIEIRLSRINYPSYDSN